MRGLFSLLAALCVAACGTTYPDGPPPGTAQDIAQLERGIRDLGPGVDPAEAALVAQLAYGYTHQLALQYQITDPPLIHNTKVNMGLRPRGLCYQWADDLEARLRQENLRSLQLHRAIANSDNPFRIEHSTVIVSRKGDTMFQGMVLDPWRKGGQLTWNRTTDDPHYVWKPRAQVFIEKGLVPGSALQR